MANVFVGISLGNKSLTERAVYDLGRIAVEELGARRLVYLIADELELINLRVFESGSHRSLATRVSKKVASVESVIGRGSEGIPRGRLSISCVHWRDILDTVYWRTYMEVFRAFLEYPTFRAAVHVVAQQFAERRGRAINAAQTAYLSMYVLAEIPTLLQGIRLDGDSYESMLYPARPAEAIDSLARDLSAGVFGPVTDCEQICTIRHVSTEP